MLLTNFDLNRKHIYQMVLAMYEEQTGDKSLYIDERAYWVNGTRDNSMNAVIGKLNKNYKSFWDILNTINKEYGHF